VRDASAVHGPHDRAVRRRPARIGPRLAGPAAEHSPRLRPSELLLVAAVVLLLMIAFLLEPRMAGPRSFSS